MHRLLVITILTSALPACQEPGAEVKAVAQAARARPAAAAAPAPRHVVAEPRVAPRPARRRLAHSSGHLEYFESSMWGQPGVLRWRDGSGKILWRAHGEPYAGTTQSDMIVAGDRALLLQWHPHLEAPAKLSAWSMQGGKLLWRKRLEQVWRAYGGDFSRPVWMRLRGFEDGQVAIWIDGPHHRESRLVSPIDGDISHREVFAPSARAAALGAPAVRMR